MQFKTMKTMGRAARLAMIPDSDDYEKYCVDLKEAAVTVVELCDYFLL